MRHLLMLIAALGLLVVACSLVQPEPDTPAVPGRAAEFPHAVHMSADVGLSCQNCHAGAEDQDAAGMPGLSTCLLCHVPEEEDAPEGALSPVLAAFFLPGESQPAWSRLTALSVPSVFSHARHAGAGVDCSSCHGDLGASEAVRRGVHVDMDACVRCHESRAVADGGCIGCHPGVDESWRPPSHDAAWERVHGRTTRVGALQHAGPVMQCDLCHREDGPTQSCEECHLSTLPEDHTLFFKNQGHGILSAMNRSRCEACHQQDMCLACHEVTAPRSHAAGWGEPRNNHCLSCHLGVRASSDCRVCHMDGAPSHDAAPVPPPSVPAHATATACMVCHATVSPPRHPFTGDGNYCRRCHQ
ncbi:MAG: hypothetical protein EYC70_00645 [Planctomycetota bacterium]|nr:MAG: hypothetical protein EYC70_00645 [Planctomycetota bacterium]